MSIASPALSETGYVRQAWPFMRLWGARAVYVGHALGLSAHRNAVGVLVIGLDEAFGVAHDPLDHASAYRACRSAVIMPNTLHHLRTSKTPIAFVYLDAASTDLRNLLLACRGQDPRFGYDLANEDRIIELLRAVAADGSAWRDVREPLGRLLDFRPIECADPRIAMALTRLNAEPSAQLGLTALATDAGLSPSRFQHLFKDATGVPLRRYRTWCRMGAALRHASEGASLTEAAHSAGFASSAHFSAAFRDMFGLAPSALKLRNIELGTVD
jgi:AraC-like DNA-binding protein